MDFSNLLVFVLLSLESVSGGLSNPPLFTLLANCTDFRTGISKLFGFEVPFEITEVLAFAEFFLIKWLPLFVEFFTGVLVLELLLFLFDLTSGEHTEEDKWAGLEGRVGLLVTLGAFLWRLDL